MSDPLTPIADGDEPVRPRRALDDSPASPVTPRRAAVDGVDPIEEVWPSDLPVDLLAPEATHPPVDGPPRSGAEEPVRETDAVTGSGGAGGRSLRSAASKAFGWSFLNTVVGRFGTLAIGIALARLLGPAEFGTFAIATVAMIAVLSFNELGVSLAIVRWEGDPKHIAPTVNTISLVMSTLLVAAMVLTAPAFASAMGDPGATDVVRLMSLSVLINGLVATPAALMQRNFQGGRRMAVDQVNTWLGAAVSLTLAIMGFGAISLAVGRIAGSVVSAVMFFVWSPLPYRLGFDRRHARALLRFGLPLAGASVIVFASGYADQLVAGNRLGATALGFYVLAFNLSSWPVSIFSQPLRNVAPAAFARLQHAPDEMNRAFATILGVLASVALPVCAVLVGAATPVIGFVYGAAWSQSAGVLLWLGVMAAFRIGFELTYDFLVVRGRSRAIFISQVTWLVVSIPALLAGAHYGGLPGVALAQVGVALLVMVPVYGSLLAGSGVRPSAAARALVLPLAASVVTGLASWALSQAVAIDLLACLASGGVGLLAMAGLLFLRRDDLRASGLLRRGRPSGA